MTTAPRAADPPPAWAPSRAQADRRDRALAEVALERLENLLEWLMRLRRFRAKRGDWRQWPPHAACGR